MGAYTPLPMLPGMMPQNTPEPQGGVTPYKPNVAAGVVQGINAFVNNYLQTQDLLQQTAQRRFMGAIQAKMIGLPVDDEQVMKWAKQAKIPLRTDPYTPEEKAFQAQQKQYQDAWSALQSGGGVSPDQAQVLNQPPPQAPATQTQTQPGLLGRMLAPFRRGQISTDSPAGDWLRRLSEAVGVSGGLPGQIAQAGERSNIEQGLFRQGAGLQSLTIDQQKQLIGMTQRAWSGDPQALDNLARSGVMKQLPGDEMSDLVRMSMPGLPEDQVKQRAGNMMLWLQGGGPQMRLAMQKAAIDMMPRFMNSPNPMMAAWNYVSDPANAPERPGWTPEEAGKRGEVFAKIHDASPDAPLGLVEEAANAQMTGNQTLIDATNKALAQWPTSGQKQSYQFGQEWGGPGAAFGGLGVRGYEAQTGRVGSAPANLDAQSMAKRVEIERGQYELAKVKAVVDAAGEEGKRAWEDFNRKDATITDKNNDLQIIANSIGKQAQIKVKLGDKDFTMADPLKTVDDWRANLTHPTWWMTGGAWMSEPSTLQGMPAAPPGYMGQIPEGTRRAIQQMNDAMSGLSQAEKSELMKRSTPPGADMSPFMQMLGAMPIGAEMPPPSK